MRNKKKCISADMLKWIALVTMFIDHIGAAILEKIPQWSFLQVQAADMILRLIGRLAFPIYCFLLVEGFYHTRNRIKYMGNLLLFALISEVPFNLAFKDSMSFAFHNVYWTLFLGMVLMMCLEKIKESYPEKYTVMALIMTGVIAVVAHILETDYGAVGILLLFILYQTHAEHEKQCMYGAVASAYEITAPLAFALIYFYNGQRKGKRGKYLFYAFYPLHLLLLYSIRMVII